MHHALAISEIIECIVRGEATLAGRARLAMVNRRFFAEAVRILWSEGGLDKRGRPDRAGVQPLVAIIQADAGRGQLYADQYRMLQFGEPRCWPGLSFREKKMRKPLAMADASQHLAMQAVGLPALQSLAIYLRHAAPDFAFDAATAVLHHASTPRMLTSLTLVSVVALGDVFFARLAAACPQLALLHLDFTLDRDLPVSLDPASQLTAAGLAGCLARLPRLATLRLRCLPARAFSADTTAAVLRVLAVLPRLEQLELPAMPDQWGTEWDAEWDAERDADISQLEPFSRLQQLAVAQLSTPALETFFGRLPRLRVLQARAGNRFMSEPPWSRVPLRASPTPLLLAVSSAMPGLHTLHIGTGDCDMALTGEATLLRFAAQCPGLRRLSLHLGADAVHLDEPPASWTDGAMDRFLRILGPQLRVLHLEWNSIVTAISWRCLMPIARHCSSLVCLFISARIVWRALVCTGITFPTLRHFGHNLVNRTARDQRDAFVEFDYAGVAKQLRRMMPLVDQSRFGNHGYVDKTDMDVEMEWAFHWEFYPEYMAREQSRTYEEKSQDGIPVWANFCPDCWGDIVMLERDFISYF